MIGRRDFITFLGGAAAWPMAARGQKGDRVQALLNRILRMQAEFGGDPVGGGLVASLNRPGGNLTGLTRGVNGRATSQRASWIQPGIERTRAALTGPLAGPA
jgi:hypothetical protein